MTESEARMIRESVAAWGRAGPALERERREQIRRTETARGIAAFAGLVHAALRAVPARQTSGLVEQQGWFLRVAERARG